MSRRRLVPVSFLLPLLLLSVGCGVGEKIQQSMGSDKAKVRVTAILEGIKKDGGGTGGDIETSICQWRKGVIRISDGGELGRASDAFSQWCRDKDIDRRISGYEVVGLTPVSGRSDAFIVSVTIEGKPYKMYVAEGEQIKWVM
jgi:hypothetical protein